MNPLSNQVFARDAIRYLFQVPEVDIATREKQLAPFEIKETEKGKKSKKDGENRENEKKGKSIYDIATNENEKKLK